jgi:predicted component of type VI protein secretion system
MARAKTGKVSETVKRLVGIEARLDVMTEHLAVQGSTLLDVAAHLAGHGETLLAIKALLEDAIALRPKVENLEHRVSALERAG